MFKFLKDLGIYGILPIFSKFIGFLLVPIYTRVFSPEDFGMIEMYSSAAMFIIFFISMEIYTAVGRYFFETKAEEDRSILVSTGLWFNVISSFFFVALVLILKNLIASKYLNIATIDSTYYAVVLWIPLNAIYSYLSVMMRFEKKPKVFVTVNVIQIIVRLTTIILLVVVAKIGISGLFVGNIAGELFGIIAISIYLKKYISFVFNRNILIKLLRFSLPLLPGLLLIGLQKPWANYIIQSQLSYTDLGLYSLGLRIVSLFTIISFGFRMAWRPYLYEQVAKGNFNRDTKRIFKFFLVVLSFAAVLLSLFAKEIVILISTEQYLDSFKVVGFLTINVMLQILGQIIGIGPEITKKTYWITIKSVIQVVVTIASLKILTSSFGLVGIPIALLSGTLASFLIMWAVTEKMLKINFPKLSIALSFAFLIVLNVIQLNYEFIIWQKAIIMILVFAVLFTQYRTIINQNVKAIREKKSKVENNF